MDKSLFYRIFNFLVESSIPLRGLPVANKGPADLSFRLASPLTSPVEYSWLHHSRGDDGEITLSVARTEEGYCLRYPGIADYHIEQEGSAITCHPYINVPEYTLRHLLLDQVVPRMTGQKGHTVVHGSAVEIDGRGVAMIGTSGSGKSTLAASFHAAGHTLLGDDSLLLQSYDRQVTGTPAYCSVRLWNDMAESLIAEPERMEYLSHYAEKRQLLFQGDEGDRNRVVPLSALFILSPSADPDEVRISRLSGNDSAMLLMNHSFLFDRCSRDMLKRKFMDTAAIAGSGLEVYRLDYPHNLDLLPRVHAGILQTLLNS